MNHFPPYTAYLEVCCFIFYLMFFCSHFLLHCIQRMCFIWFWSLKICWNITNGPQICSVLVKKNPCALEMNEYSIIVIYSVYVCVSVSVTGQLLIILFNFSIYSLVFLLAYSIIYWDAERDMLIMYYYECWFV